ncbi:hypothetical protein PLESTB_000833900 [Pleodorina starrii]|uniref:Uncharacterized protein n=1 Tax=Pleodorina starrii TaxID=330485 RepID=A0A9W6BL50_9CHLO|nr:hypothetical protein PLESTB_000833900 [Pleodorina starrii]GLC64500.1 hypothetical protein PLESTF_000172800 [Pleodorina starrii]
MDAQLSEAQRTFVQFCGVLQELILNHQVAHSVIQSLHNDLPALQPERSGPGRHASSGFGAGGSTAQKAASALEQLQLLAPRLTPSAAVATGGGGDPSYRVAAECQDNYIVLQNATLRSRDLLRRLGELRRTAATALERQDPGSETGAAQDPDPAPERDPDQDPGSSAADPEGRQRHRQPGGSGGGEAGEPAGLPLTELDAGASDVDVDVDVDVVLAPDPISAADGAAAAAAASLGPDPVFATPSSASGGLTAASSAAAAAPPPPPQSSPAVLPLSGPDLAIFMGELCREVALEVEMLGRIAAAVELQTSAEDLYAYDMMLKLQPYTDERLVAAALAQRDLLVRPRAAAATGSEGRGQLAAAQPARR